MNLSGASPQSGPRGRRIAAAFFMVGLWLILNILTVCPSLHHLVHGDSDSVTHDCFVTQFASGHSSPDLQGETGVAPPLVAEHVFRVAEVRWVLISEHRLPGSRGPPPADPAAASG